MLSSALAFATIVQLITIFKQETNSADIGEFKTWLEEHNFPKLRTLLGDDPETTRRVEASGQSHYRAPSSKCLR